VGAELDVIRTFQGVTPAVAASAYVDESAQIIGDVTVGDESSVWMNAVVRGDVNAIRVGRRTNLQDGTIVHVMRDPSHQTVVGDEVTVGQGVVLHGCTVEDCCLIGMGAILLNGCRVGAGSLVAAGTLVPEGAVIPPGSLVVGSPGRVRRQLTAEELAFIRQSADNYVRYRLDYV
jgi:carbonic anhydrase/acetyltransferase-like protein (isoleucine patch superfamily)